MANFFDRFDENTDASQKDNARAAFDFFVSKGYEPHQASGIVGNLIGESGKGLNPNARNPRDGQDGTDSIGIAQWNAGRSRALQSFALSKGRPWNDLNTQLEFLHAELQGPERGANARLIAAQTPEEAGQAFLHFERPKNYDRPGAHPERAQYSRMAYNSYGGTSGTTDISAQSKKGNFFDQFDNAQEAAAAPGTASQGGRPRVVIDTSNIGQQSVSPPVPEKHDKGAVDAFARGAASGVTANFYDEIRGLIEASGAKKEDPASLVNLIVGAYKKFSGDADAQKRYDEAVARERGITKLAEEQHPVASIAGNVVGAVAVPIGATAQGATLPARMGSGALVGGGFGALSGAGEGEGLPDRAAKALTGGAGGLVLGAVAPAAIEGVVKGARAVSQPIANALRGVRYPEAEAARRVGIALERDYKNDPLAAKRITPQEFVQDTQAGGSSALVDVGGETTRALARSAANTSPEGRQALEKTINDRFEGQASRVNDWFRQSFHYPDASAQAEALTQAGRNVNRPAYQRAYKEGAGGIWDDSLSQLSQAPVLQDAIRKASVTAANDAAKMGVVPVRNPFIFDKASGRYELKALPDGSTLLPNLQFWDAVKKNLDRVGTRDAQDYSRVLRDHLDTLVPSYKEARAGAAQFFGAQNALEAGQKFVTSKMANGDARRALAQMSDTERKLFQDGFVSDYIAKLNESGDRRSILNQIAQSPAARERLEIALGPMKARELEARLRIEGVMDLARGAVQGNSTTARQLAELGLAGGAYSVSGGGINPLADPGAAVNAALVYGAARGKGRINENVSKKIAELLTSNDPQKVLGAVRTVAQSKQLFNSLRSADSGLARVGATEAPTVPVLQAAGVGRADDQQ